MIYTDLKESVSRWLKEITFLISTVHNDTVVIASSPKSLVAYK